MDPSADGVSTGARLRDIRLARKLSLTTIEEQTKGRFKASILGAYERAERAISVPRLMELARFYGIDPGSVLPSVTNTNELRRAVLAARLLLSIQLHPELRGTVASEALDFVAEADKALAEALFYLDPDDPGCEAATPINRYQVVPA